MDIKTFEKCIEKLITMYGVLPDDKMDIYYEQLKDSSPRILEATCSLIIASHRAVTKFPSVPEIKDAISIAFEDRKAEEQPPRPGYCTACNGTGLMLSEYIWSGKGYTQAKPCDCEAGRPFKTSFRRYLPKPVFEPRQPGPWHPPMIEELEEEKPKTKDPF